MTAIVLALVVPRRPTEPDVVPERTGDPLLDEDFDVAADWYRGDDRRAAVKVEDGRYTVRVKRPSYVFIATSARDAGHRGLAVEGDATPETGSPEALIGIGCEAPRERGYYFVVDPWNARFLIFESRSARRFALLGGGTEHVRSISPPGELNRLHAECVHSQTGITSLRFWVNDRLLYAANLSDGSQSFSGVSVAVVSVGAADAVGVFDNIVAFALERPARSSIPIAGSLRPEPEPPISSLELVHAFSNVRTAPFGTERAEDHSFGYIDGEYRITVETAEEWWRWSRWYGRGSPAVTVMTTARKGSLGSGRARFGVYCVSKEDPEDIYGFLVDPDEGWYQIWKLEDDVFESVLAEGESGAISFGTDRSFIRGDCRSRGSETELSMYVNGWFVDAVRDQDGFGRFSGVGLVGRALAPDADVRFDDVLFARLRSSG